MRMVLRIDAQFEIKLDLRRRAIAPTQNTCSLTHPTRSEQLVWHYVTSNYEKSKNSNNCPINPPIIQVQSTNHSHWQLRFFTEDIGQLTRLLRYWLVPSYDDQNDGRQKKTVKFRCWRSQFRQLNTPANPLIHNAPACCFIAEELTQGGQCNRRSCA